MIALIYETGREIDSDFDGYIDGLYDLLKELATDSSKYRAKREKKQQKSIFRDILKTVEVSDWEFVFLQVLINESYVHHCFIGAGIDSP